MSVVTLQVLYKLKTSKLFDSAKCRATDASDRDHLFAINMMYLCVESRLICVAGAEHVLLFRFSKQESMIDCPVGFSLHFYDGCSINKLQNGRHHFSYFSSGKNLNSACVETFC